MEPDTEGQYRVIIPHILSSLQTSACALPASAPCAMARDAEHTATRRFTLERVTPRRAEVQGHREMRGAGIPHVRGEEASVPPCQPCYCRTAAPWVVCGWRLYCSNSAAACLRA